MIMRAPLKATASAALLALPLAFPTLAQAQSSVSESVSATATILAGLEIAADTDLAFGELLPGVPRTVANSDSDAAQFIITGAPSASVNLVFTSLPTALESEEGNSLPVSFSGSSAGFGPASRTVAESFNPAASRTTSLAAGTLYVMLGGTASPAPAQPEGSYTGTITLEVSYSGS
jgi:hypothetical protein